MKHTIELEPFTIPNFVRAKSKVVVSQVGFKEIPPIPLEDLSVNTLHELCNQFTKDVFARAGKKLTVEGYVDGSN